MKAVDSLVHQMARRGVEVIFGIPGGANLPLYDSLYDSSIQSILMKHEQQAIHAAEGYARVKGKPGLVTATSGPGATNLITGLVNAWMDSTPVVAITGQVVRQFMGTDAFQEADIVGLVLPHTKYATTVMDPHRLAQEFVNAYENAMTGRQGPVLLDVPRDVMQADVDSTALHDLLPEKQFVRRPPAPSKDLIASACKAISLSERPVILVGGGVYSSNATREVLRLAEIIGAPVVTTTPGKTAVPEDHPLVLGVVGMHGRLEADLAIIESDLVLCVGTRLSDRAVGPPKDFSSNKRIIHIDVDPSEVGKNVSVDIGIVGDAKEVLSMILADIESYVDNRPIEDKVTKFKEIGRSYDEYMINEMGSSTITSWKVVSILREELPRDAIVTTGVGQHQMWAQLFYRVYEPGTFITSSGLGTMGFGLPAAFGAKVAAPERIVVDMDGDGSFLMTCQTLASIAEYGYPVIVVVFDNRTLGMVRQWQDMFYRKRIKDSDIPDLTDIIKLSQSFGVEAVFVDSLESLRSSVRRAVANDEALVLDVPIHKDEKVYPMVPPGKYLSDVIVPPGFEVHAKLQT
ncbi:MAG: biosynthetic-type acetolactate synthase large subunit [Aigarchaeota archaeon]|nr:biosynthetic-type acetolactate synthase large subunit [Aigarchaeota archaeon]MDW8092169.1 biosynthetic-type acetolactate synthase large subunit [Nitrososphaerota archaeon]